MHICKGYFVGTGEIVRLPCCVRNNYVPWTHDVIITSFYVKTMLRRRFDVIITLLLRHVSAGWRIWVNRSHESTTTDDITTTKQNTASQCVYFVMDISLAITDVWTSIWSSWYWNYGFGPIFIKKNRRTISREINSVVLDETVLSLKKWYLTPNIWTLTGYASLTSHHGSRAILARVRFFAQKAQIHDRTACTTRTTSNAHYLGNHWFGLTFRYGWACEII